MSAFKYDIPNGKAEAKLYSMFKFPESNRVHFQCDILVCNGKIFVFDISFMIFSKLFKLTIEIIDENKIDLTTLFLQPDLTIAKLQFAITKKKLEDH